MTFDDINFGQVVMKTLWFDSYVSIPSIQNRSCSCLERQNLKTNIDLVLDTTIQILKIQRRPQSLEMHPIPLSTVQRTGKN